MQYLIFIIRTVDMVLHLMFIHKSDETIVLCKASYIAWLQLKACMIENRGI